MLARIAQVVVRRRRIVLVAAVVAFAVSGMIGGGVADKLSSGGFDDPAAESSKAENALLDEFGAGTPNFILLVTAKDGHTVDDPEVVAAGKALTAKLAAEDGMTNVVSYWTLPNAVPLRSNDSTRGLVLARTATDDDNEMLDVAKELGPIYNEDTDLLDVQVTGFAQVFNEVGDTIEKDLVTAESLALPITLILLL